MKPLCRVASIMLLCHAVSGLTSRAFAGSTTDKGNPLPKGNQAFVNSGIFVPYRHYPKGGEAVAIGDVNHDGRNDVVVKEFDEMYVYIQNSSGELDPAVEYLVGRGKSVDVGDLNNDGKDDVAVGAGTTLGVLLQNDFGELGPMATYPRDHSLILRIGDFNGDRRNDVVSMRCCRHRLHVFHQSTLGTLMTPVVHNVRYGGNDDLEVADLNLDGLTDVVVMSGGANEDDLGVFQQDASGGLTGPTSIDLEGLTGGVGVGDINGDTLPDLVLTTSANRPFGRINVLLQTDAGTFAPPILYPAYDLGEPVEIGDVNHDGRNDVLVAHSGWEALGVYLQGEDGSLLPYELYAVPYTAHYNKQGMAIGDINGDGRNDVVVSGNGLSVLINVGAMFSRSDANADGEIDISDAIYSLRFQFLSKHDPTCLKSLDAEDDGDIDVHDVIVTLEHLFRNEPPPPAPFALCGVDPTPDSLTCAAHTPCL